MSNFPEQKPPKWWLYAAIVFAYTVGMVLLSFYSSYHGCQ